MHVDDKTMLALAALTYRGFGHQSEAAIDRALRPWLPKLEPEGLGRWDLVWGPATFRASTSLVDDAMVYVAKQKEPPGGRPRYAIAIRGTNPVSVFDWVFGDFWVQLQIDQVPPGNPPARLSASTALGVGIVQHLDAEDPPSSSNRLAPLASMLATTLQEFAPTLPELDPCRVFQVPGSFSDLDLQTRIRVLTGAEGTSLRTRVSDRLRVGFASAAQPLHDVNRQVFDGLMRRVGTAPARGKSLLEFLKDVEPDARIAVTGHSKGGALAIAVALWLAESWAPAHRAEVECFSFAGPTAGNEAFAQRYNALLATRTRRIVNRRDLVPHAWVPSELADIGETYPALSAPLSAVSRSVKELGYTHVGGELVEIPSRPGPGGVFQELVYQHLDAYLAVAEFQNPEWKTASLFLST